MSGLKAILEYRQITLFPTCIGNIRVCIENLNVKYMKNTEECGLDEAWSGSWIEAQTLTEKELGVLVDTVKEIGFFELPETMISESVSDGCREEIEIEIGDRSHQVTMQNSENPVFSLIKKMILKKIPPL